MSYPGTGQSPWGQDLKGYIDQGDARALAAALEAENSAADAAQSEENAASSEENAAASAQSAASSQAGAEAAQTAAEQARDDAVDISNISTSDDVVEALIRGTAGAGPKTRLALADRFGESVNVEAFGAVGDFDFETGLGTDCQQAFLDAFATGKAVYVPAGNFDVRTIGVVDQDIRIYGPGTLVHRAGEIPLLLTQQMTEIISITSVELGWTGASDSSVSLSVPDLFTRINVPGASLHTQFAHGDAFLIYSNDQYTWRPGGYRAEFLTVEGFMLELSGSTDAGWGVDGEAVGLTSGASAAVKARAFGSSTSDVKVLLYQVDNADFAIGESVEVDGTPVGTVQGFYPVSQNILLDEYTTTPKMRRVQRENVVDIDVTIQAYGDIHAAIGEEDRTPAIKVAGAYFPTIRAHIKSAWNRAIQVNACYRGDIYARVDELPNKAELSEQAYGYGVELASSTQEVDVRVLASNIRHAFTTNTFGTSYETGTFNYLSYGTVKWCRVYDSVSSNSRGTAFDTHDGAWGMQFENCHALYGAHMGLATTQGSGFTNRAHATTFRDCTSRGFRFGFTEAGIDDDEFKPFKTVYENCKALDFLENGFTTTSSAVEGSAIEIEYRDCHASARQMNTNAPFFQHAFRLRRTKMVRIKNCSAEKANGTAVRITSGSLIVDGFYSDHSEANMDGLRVDSTMTFLEVDNWTARVVPGVRPDALFRNAGGDSEWNVSNVNVLPSGAQMPPLFQRDSAESNFPVYNVKKSVSEEVERSVTVGDEDFTLGIRNGEPPRYVVTEPLTAPRTASLPFTGSTQLPKIISGDTLTISRLASSTGEDLTVDAVDYTHTLLPGQWVKFLWVVDGWQTMASGVTEPEAIVEAEYVDNAIAEAVSGQGDTDQAGSLMAIAERANTFNTTSQTVGSTSAGLIAGMGLVLTGEGRNVEVAVSLHNVQHSAVSGAQVTAYLNLNGTLVRQHTVTCTPNNGTEVSLYFTFTVQLAAGTDHVLELGIAGRASGTAQAQATTTQPMRMVVTRK